MRLTRFRVTNFRSVTDSEWIDTERVTSLIGVNESGKTNLLLPLWKLNPAREGEIKPTSDYPKDNYAAVRADPGDFDFITAEFDVSDLEDKLAAMTGVDRQFVDIVHVTRNFAGEYSVSFPKHEPAQFASRGDLEKLIAAGPKELADRARVLRQDVTRALEALARNGARFAVVFLDPPYASPDAAPALERIAHGDCLLPGAVVVTQHPTKAPPPTDPGVLRPWKSRRFGETTLTFFRSGA